jgi:acyl-CoA thioesterase
MGSFEQDTAVRGGQGSYTALLSAGWQGWTPHGGYLGALLLRAVAAETTLRPASFHCHFLRTPSVAEVSIHVSAEYRGRRSESWRVTMHQGDQQILFALVRTVAEAPGLEHELEATICGRQHTVPRIRSGTTSSVGSSSPRISTCHGGC